MAMNDYEHRFHNQEVGEDGARWTLLNTEKRAGDCVLEAKDISSYSWAKTRFVDKDWSGVWNNIFPYPERKTVSHAMTDCLRHNGCKGGENLRCDSGGWFVLADIVAEIERKSHGWHWPSGSARS